MYVAGDLFGVLRTDKDNVDHAGQSVSVGLSRLSVLSVGTKTMRLTHKHLFDKVSLVFLRLSPSPKITTPTVQGTWADFWRALPMLRSSGATAAGSPAPPAPPPPPVAARPRRRACRCRCSRTWRTCGTAARARSRARTPSPRTNRDRTHARMHASRHAREQACTGARTHTGTSTHSIRVPLLCVLPFIRKLILRPQQPPHPFPAAAMPSVLKPDRFRPLSVFLFFFDYYFL